LAERAFWDDYQRAYEEAIEATSTAWAPWYVIPADHKWVTRAVVADIITTTLLDLKLKYPVVSDEQQRQLAAARKKLLAD
jgi:polyphosphate kinase 2 (PPK2 family)